MKERLFIFFLAMISAMAPLATDMYLPALSLVQNSFNTSEFYIQLSIASFFIAFAFGQLIYGALSDVFGRKKPLIIGLSIFIISSILCVFVENIYIFIFLRFTQALGGCAGVVIGRAIVNDTFKGQKVVAVFSLMMICTSLAPMISPSIGGVLLRYYEWRSIFITLFLIGLLLLILSIFYLKESHFKRVSFSISNIFKAYKSVLTKKSFMIYVLSSSFAMSSLFAYISGSSFVFTNIFNISLQHYALIFGTNSLGYMCAARLNIFLTRRFGVEIITKFAILTMFFSSILLIIFSNNFYTFTVFLFLTLCMLGFITPNLVTKAMRKAKKFSGSASAILGAMQFIFAGFSAFLVGFTNSNTSFALACMISMFCLIASLVYVFKIQIVKFL